MNPEQQERTKRGRELIKSIQESRPDAKSFADALVDLLVDLHHVAEEEFKDDNQNSIYYMEHLAHDKYLQMKRDARNERL